ncbi:hypothetical protein ACJX0J_036314, partial [Zea mays]
VRTRQPVLGKGAKVVPITLDQVYMLKAEGIAFRFLPDPLQIKNALEMKSGLTAFDGVPVFQSDLLVVKKQKKRYCPVYFQKEDIERELTRASKGSRGSALSKKIMVGSLEDDGYKMAEWILLHDFGLYNRKRDECLWPYSDAYRLVFLEA